MTRPRVSSERLLERFLRYVAIETTANPDSTSYPSSPGQLELGKVLVGELEAMGIEAEQDAHGLVWGLVPATTPGNIPSILFNSHLDTSPDASGKNVQAQVIDSYQGGDIPLPRGEQVITVADCPALKHLEGHCLITTDGTTLLGGDDKAGVAAIMELAATLMENPSLEHGPVRILFSCDEEIGLGAKHMCLDKAGAVAGYTLDGSGQGEVENENFSADQMELTVRGKNIHPSIAKGKMHNAIKGLSIVLAELPPNCSPEQTEGKAGFIHPYAMAGDVSLASAKFLLRDFETDRLDEHEATIRQCVEVAATKFPELDFQVRRDRQYRNMLDFLRPQPHIVDYAMQAHQDLGTTPILGSIRGGTDGAQFSEMGLPTPNLSVGQHNIHSVLEFASLDEMTYAVQHAIALLDRWQAHARS